MADEQTKVRNVSHPVLTAREIALLDEGPVKEIWIGPREGYTQHRLVRKPQQLKDLSIQTWADEWFGRLERYGITAADRRHAQRLIELLHDTMEFDK